MKPHCIKTYIHTYTYTNTWTTKCDYIFKVNEEKDIGRKNDLNAAFMIKWYDIGIVGVACDATNNNNNKTNTLADASLFFLL